MTLSATITSVSIQRGCIALTLAHQPSNGYQGVTTGQLLITSYTRVPVVGQRITGTAGHVVVEGGGGERIVYARQGAFLTEVSE